MIGYAGLYERSNHVNSKRSWISTDNVTAIWYNPPSNDWVFGTVENIGKDLGLIHSNYNEENIACPHEVPLDKWSWYSNHGLGSWLRATGGEIHVKCNFMKLVNLPRL